MDFVVTFLWTLCNFKDKYSLFIKLTYAERLNSYICENDFSSCVVGLEEDLNLVQRPELEIFLGDGVGGLG